MRCPAILLSFAFLLNAQRSAPVSPESFIAEMMKFDQDHDGRIARQEITDARLLRLFDHADVDHDGFVSPAELRQLYQKESVAFVADRNGPGGPDFRRGPPRVGQLIPDQMRGELNLTADQKQKLDTLQKQVDTQLQAILTDSQREQLTRRGPGPQGRPFGPPGPRRP